jgi:hypothetical protein
MAPKFPQRPRSHQLASESENFLRRYLPKEWTCDAVTSDYGVDFRLGIVTDGQVTGKELLVQLKASTAEDPGESVVVRLRTSTFRYVWDMLPVALLVKYIAKEDEAYWLLWKDVVAPSDDQETFTVRIPRANQLSQNPWPTIERHIQHIHARKLGWRAE